MERLSYLTISRTGLNRSIEGLVAALERHPIASRHGNAIVSVCGVHLDAGTMWLQVSVHNGADRYLILQLPPEATVHDALAAIEESDDRQDYLIQVRAKRVRTTDTPSSPRSTMRTESAIPK